MIAAKAVADTSVIQYLCLIGRVDLPAQLFGEIWTTSHVMAELQRGGPLSPNPISKLSGEWRIATDIPALMLADDRLGMGERSVIALANGLQAVAVLDDLDARREAFRQGLSITGILGVLTAARQQQLIGPLAVELDRLQLTGFRLGSALRIQVLRAVGE